MKLKFDDFIKRANEFHKNKYHYSFDKEWWNTNYRNSYTKIPIICPIHGEFFQSVNGHLRYNGCPKCSNNIMKNKLKMTYDRFITKTRSVHNNKCYYPFDENWWDKNYKNRNQKIPIICPIHGEFFQSVKDHIDGCGCNSCSINESVYLHKNKYEDFIKRSNEFHKNKYTYPSKEWWDKNYKNAHMKIPIICPIHGEFEQKAYVHLNNHGCPSCNSSRGESIISKYLSDNNINFINQYPVVINDSYYYFDFYLPDYNLFIEYDGIQHFKPISFFGGEDGFIDIKRRDGLKNKYVVNNGGDIIRIKYYDDVLKVLHEKLFNIGAII